jgi:transposase
MPDKRRTYTAEFNREAVHLVTEQGYALAEAARNLGLNPHMLQRWQRALVEEEHAAFPGNGRVSLAQEALPRLREENRRLRLERDMLKKAWGFLASESRCEMPLSSSTGRPGQLRSSVRYGT